MVKRLIPCLAIIAILFFSYISPSTAQPIPGRQISVTDSDPPGDDRIINFGTISIGSASTHSVILKNPAPQPLSIFQIAGSVSLALPFTILNDNCSDIVLAFNETCTLDVKIEPSSAGSFNDSFDIPSNADEGTFLFTVNGTGSTVPVPDITVTDPVSPASDLNVPFGPVPIDSQSDKTITIGNSGNGNLQIFNIAQANQLAAPFSIPAGDDNCSNTVIAPSGLCAFKVRFEPTSSSSVSDAFDIPSDDPDESTVTVAVSGSGGSSPDITITDNTGNTGDLKIDFGKKAINTSQDSIVQITNDGSDTLNISGIATGDVLDAPFLIQNNSCTSASLEPAEFCTFTVNFSPSTLSVSNDSFDIQSNDPDESIVTISVSGGNDLPTQPQLVSPQDNATGVALTSDFTWAKSTDPDSDAITYSLKICEDTNFTTGCISQTNIVQISIQPFYYAGLGSGFMFIGVVFAGNMRDRKKIALLFVLITVSTLLFASCGGSGGGSSDPPASGNNITRSVSVPNTGTQYHWKVTANDSRGGVSESLPRSFTTQ